MPKITRLGRVMVPVSDQDEAIGFYTGALGFSVVADVPFGDNDRWVEVDQANSVHLAGLAPTCSPWRLQATRGYPGSRHGW